MIPQATLRAIVQQIYRQPGLFGCLVAFEGNHRSYILEPGTIMAPNFDRVMVILEEVPGDAIRQEVRAAAHVVARPIERWDDATVQSTANFLSDALDAPAVHPRFRTLGSVLERRGDMGPMTRLYGMARSDRYAALESALRQATQTPDGVRELNEALRESRMAATPGWQNSANPEGPAFQAITNRSRVASELTSTGITCAFTIVSAWGVAGGAAAEVPTGGTSTFLVIVAWAGFTTSGIQCVNGMVRVSEAAFYNPDENTLQEWDANAYYTGAAAIVDAIGLATSVLSAPADVRDLWTVLKGGSALRVTEQQFLHMPRPERVRVMREALQVAARTPEGRNAIARAVRATHQATPPRIARPNFNITRPAAESLGLSVVSVLSDGVDFTTGDTSGWLYVHLVERNGQ